MNRTLLRAQLFREKRDELARRQIKQTGGIDWDFDTVDDVQLVDAVPKAAPIYPVEKQRKGLLINVIAVPSGKFVPPPDDGAPTPVDAGLFNDAPTPQTPVPHEGLFPPDILPTFDWTPPHAPHVERTHIRDEIVDRSMPSAAEVEQARKEAKALRATEDQEEVEIRRREWRSAVERRALQRREWGLDP